MKVNKGLLTFRKGGAGSGHHGHSGRPGKRGGSSPGGGIGGGNFITEDDSMYDVTIEGDVDDVLDVGFTMSGEGYDEDYLSDRVADLASDYAYEKTGSLYAYGVIDVNVYETDDTTSVTAVVESLGIQE